MNEKESTIFRRLIEARLVELENEDELGRESQGTVQLDQQSVGRLSRMDALQSQAMARAAQARRNVSRQKLMAALSRLEEGEFGFCEDCGEEIPTARLKSEPTLQRCITCVRG